MTLMIARGSRIGSVTLVVAMLAAASGGDAAARTGKGRHHPRRVVAAVAKGLYPASQQPVRLGAMRYYGGPKSPMWRAPVEN